jgi:magnesium-transporting ATPase (P-type)
MEAAIDALARRMSVDLAADEAERPPTRRFPFDPVLRQMSVEVDGQLLVKGAADTVLPECRDVPPEAPQAARRFGERGLRVLAVATGTGDDLRLLGLLALEDPPRPGARDAIATCRAAGIAVAMVTGDHSTTALAIATEVGLWQEGAPVLEGADLPEDERALGELIDVDGVVVARVSPEDKLRIARALRDRGHVVAMTGDGVNDGPALREADIGVAMGASGTDVAREAADLVLLNDDFSTIVTAVRHGRATFANVRRFLTYHLTDNVAELAPFVVWALSGGEFPLALGVLQILCLDIGTDLLPALALGAEPPAGDVLDRPLRNQHLVDRHLLFRVFGVLGPTEAGFALAAFAAVLATDAPVAVASGAAFTAVVLGQMANGFACRSTSRPPWRIRDRANPLLRVAVVAELVVLMGFLFVPPVARVLEHEPPSALGWAMAALTPVAVLVADAVHKEVQLRKRVRTG